MSKFIVFVGADGLENTVSPNMSSGLSIDELAILVVPAGVPYIVVEGPLDVGAPEAREQRNALLASSDWTQVADAPVDQVAWATYRQALRDITAQAGFPTDINWPVAPE